MIQVGCCEAARVRRRRRDEGLPPEPRADWCCNAESRRGEGMTGRDCDWSRVKGRVKVAKEGRRKEGTAAVEDKGTGGVCKGSKVSRGEWSDGKSRTWRKK